MTQDALFSIDERNFAQAGTRIPITFIVCDVAALRTQGAYIDGSFTFGSYDNREFKIFSAQSNCSGLMLHNGQ